MKYAIILALGCGSVSMAAAEFTLKDDGQGVTVLDKGQPVLTYNYGDIPAPEEVAGHLTRATYVHPLYGLDGDVLTEDFPADHYHHRGVFWSWPNNTVGGEPLNTWLMDSSHQVFDKWLETSAGATANLAVQNYWSRNDASDVPIVEEIVKITVLPASDMARAIDFELTFKNVDAEKRTVTILGAPTDNKGYGGFCIRPVAARKPHRFTSDQGTHEKDVLRLDSPWADVTSQIPGQSDYSGTAIFQHPGNPDYPHKGWILRNYSFLGASWPCLDPCDLAPGESVTLKYRLLVHHGTAEEAGVARMYQEYLRGIPEAAE